MKHTSVIKYSVALLLTATLGQFVLAENLTPTLKSDSAYELQESAAKTDTTITNQDVNTTNKKEYYIDKDGEAKTIQYEVKSATPKYYDIQLKDDAEKTKYSNKKVSPTRVDAGNFIGNTSGKEAVTRINSDFINNTITTKGISGGGLVGSLNNAATEIRVENITGDYINNTIEATNISGGGLIGNYGYGYSTNSDNIITNLTQIDNIKGNFIGNKFTISSYYSGGGIIGNFAFSSKNADVTTKIGSITGNFYNNDLIYTPTNATYNNLYGGGLIGNYAHTEQGSSTAEIENISGNFVNNKITSNSTIYGGGLIGNYTNTKYSTATANAKIGKISGNFIKNTVKADQIIIGGLIGNYGATSSNRATLIKEINANFYNNHVESTSTEEKNNRVQGGVIANFGNYGTINKITGNFIENGVIVNSTHKSAYVSGGVIYNGGSITEGIVNSNFIGNYAKANVAQGGAIYSLKDISIIADNATSIFSGNYVQTADGKDDNAIYIAGNTATLTLETKNKGSILMKDNINGVEGYNVHIKSDGTGTFYMHNEIRNANVTFDNTNISMVNNEIQDYTFNSLTLSGTTKLYVDVDLAGKTMDRFTAKTYGGDGKLSIAGMNILSDSTDTSEIIKFIDSELAKNVDTTVKTAYSPIYKYTVSYVIDSEDGNGYFKFERGAGSSSSSKPSTNVITEVPGLITKSKTEFYTNSSGKATFVNYAVKSADAQYYSDKVENTVATAEYSGKTSSPSYVYGYTINGNKFVTKSGVTTIEQNLTNIEGNFVGNTITAKYSIIGTGLVGNYAVNPQSEVDSLVIEKVSGSFIKNTITANNVYGAGLVGNYSNTYFTDYHSGTEIKEIQGSYIGNTINAKNNLYGGGLIGNYGSTNTYYYDDGRVYNSPSASAKIGSISGDFYNNTVYHSTSSTASYYSMRGGGIIGNSAINASSRDDVTNLYIKEEHAVSAEISSISGNFVNNLVKTGIDIVGGGIIGNYASGNIDPEIANTTTATIGEIKGTFVSNNITAKQHINGGVIGNTVTGSKSAVTRIKEINADFYNNHVESTNTSVVNGRAQGGAISNYIQLGTGQTLETAGQAYIGKISGMFYENGVISNSTGQGSTAKGGAIFNNGEITEGIVNSSFIGNYAKSAIENGAMGGAIYSDRDIKIVSDKYTSVFSNNYTESAGVKEDNAIYINNATLTIETKNKGSIIMKDSINGENYNVNITGDGTGTFHMFNDIKNANVTFGTTNISMIDNEVRSYTFDSLTLAGKTKLYVDVDLANKEMDRISAGKYGSHSGKINVAGLNLISDGVDTKTKILFTEKGLSHNVTINKVAYSPVYKYGVSYSIDSDSDEGYVNFTRAGVASKSSGGGNSYTMYNPAVLATPAAAITGLYTAQLQTFTYAFRHSDVTMNNPLQARKLEKMEGRYALASNDGAGVFSPLLTKPDGAGIWIRPYATFENVPLKNGPKVGSISYGTLVGFDEPLKELKYGWDRVITYYLGYNGASQSYTGVDSYQNGGLLGSTVTLYKNNFFNATTISAGANVGENSTMYGSETFTAIIAGIANKMGYNAEFFDGKFIIQPSMLVGYTFINAFDYTNAAGVRINSDPMSIIQLAPTLKFIGNTKNGWQPYLAVGMVWNIMAHSQVSANNVELPNMYIKPYVQYGVGVQKIIKKRLTAFGQAMIYNGGRNGVSLTTGVRYMIGK